MLQSCQVVSCGGVYAAATTHTLAKVAAEIPARPTTLQLVIVSISSSLLPLQALLVLEGLLSKSPSGRTHFTHALYAAA